MISIVIPSWNGRHLLETSIPAISAQTDKTHEIIVVDNGSTDGTGNWLRECWPNVKCVELTQNQGFSGGVNVGISAAGGNDVILVNNDTQAAPGWLNALIKASLSHPEYHIFASRVLMAETPHRIDTAGDGFTIAGFGYKIGWLQPDGPEYDYSREIFSASGCAVYIRREVFRTIGIFDEQFFAFGEDLDFSFRARLAGFRVMYTPDARIYHSVRATASPVNTLFWYHRNLIWLLVKNLPCTLWFLYGPHILIHAGFIAFRSLAGGWLRIYLRSLGAAVKGIPSMLRKRSEIQSSRRISIAELRKGIEANWISIHWKLHKAKCAYRSIQK